MHLIQTENSICGVYSYIRLFCVDNIAIPFKSTGCSEHTHATNINCKLNIRLPHFNALYALTIII